MLTQITKRTGVITRVKPEDGPPVIELDLERGQYVVGVELTQDYSYRDRKTVDWSWRAFVVTPLGEPGNDA